MPDENYVDTFNCFHDKVKELRASELIKEGLSVKHTISINQSEFQSTIKQPDETNLRAYLTTFRQFILAKERVNLDKIYDLCQAHLKDEKLKGWLATSQGFWKKAFDTASVGLKYNGRELSPQDVSDLFLYGDIFHGDPDKELFLKALLPHEYNSLRWLFLEFIIRATEQIFYVDDVVTVGLKDGLFS